MIDKEVFLICFISMVLSLTVFILASYANFSFGFVLLFTSGFYILVAILISMVYFRTKKEPFQ